MARLAGNENKRSKKKLAKIQLTYIATSSTKGSRGSLSQVPHLSIGKYELAEHPSKKKAWFHYLITPRACQVEPITPDRATPVALEAFVPT